MQKYNRTFAKTININIKPEGSKKACIFASEYSLLRHNLKLPGIVIFSMTILIFFSVIVQLFLGFIGCSIRQASSSHKLCFARLTVSLRARYWLELNGKLEQLVLV